MQIFEIICMHNVYWVLETSMEMFFMLGNKTEPHVKYAPTSTESVLTFDWVSLALAHCLPNSVGRHWRVGRCWSAFYIWIEAKKKLFDQSIFICWNIWCLFSWNVAFVQSINLKLNLNNNCCVQCSNEICKLIIY